jgi:acetyl esterase/lipase
MMKVASELSDFLNKANELIRLDQEQGIVMTPKLARSNLANLAKFSPEKETVAAIIDRRLELSDREIPVRIYRPDTDKTLPALIYFHGGGHMCGSIEIYDGIARRLANSTTHIVISVDYRLAPEFPFPCGQQDCLAVTEHLNRVLDDIPYHDDKLVLAGDSAGGALAVSVARETQQPIKKLVLIYPSLDYTFHSDSYQRFAQGYLLETSRIHWYFDQYFNESVDRVKDSPLFFTGLESLPDTLIIAAGLDPLVDEGKKFHDKLTALGINSQYHLEPDLIHAFMNLGALIPKHIQRVTERISTFINE